MTDYLSEAQRDLNFYIETMYLWDEVEAAWSFPEQFTLEFQAWLKKKAQEKAQELMDTNP